MSEKQPAKSPLEQQLLGMGTLLQLEQQSRHAASEAEFAFLVVNETRRLLNYRQAALCRRLSPGKIRIAAVSGGVAVDPHSPYIIWLRRLLTQLLSARDPAKPQQIARDQAPAEFRAEWQEWAPAFGLWCPLVLDNMQAGGLWLCRETPWQPAEIALLQQLADSYSHDWLIWLQHPGWRPRSGIIAGRGGLLKWLLPALLLALLLLPVRLSVLAPAQVVAVDPVMVTSPLKGVIKEFHVQPNQQVKAGQLLFSLNDVGLRNHYEVTRKALEVIKAEYQQTRRRSLLKEGSDDLDLLLARVEGKEAEVNYAAEELSRVSVRAGVEGLAIYDSNNDWLGRPVEIGEKILAIADPRQTELEIQVPVDNAVNLEKGALVRMFLNIDPSRSLTATLRQTSYEAMVTPENILAFKVKAGFTNQTTPPRIGLRGTAKIYGERKNVYYFLLRRPMAALRRILGW